MNENTTIVRLGHIADNDLGLVRADNPYAMEVASCSMKILDSSSCMAAG